MKWYPNVSRGCPWAPTFCWPCSIVFSLRVVRPNGSTGITAQPGIMTYRSATRDLTSQRFWDPMNSLTPEQIRAAETALTRHMVHEFGWDLSTVVYHATNFSTGIDTHTPSELAQRGHQKQHRTDWRSIGLALMVTTDFNIP